MELPDEYEVQSTLVSQSHTEEGEVSEQIWDFTVEHLRFLACFQYTETEITYELFPSPHYESWTQQMHEVVQAWVVTQAGSDEEDIEAVKDFLDSLDE